jgi:hypothetical protein
VALGQVFSRVLRFPLLIFIPPIAQSPSSTIWDGYNRPVVAAVPSWLSLTPLRTIIIIKILRIRDPFLNSKLRIGQLGIWSCYGLMSCFYSLHAVKEGGAVASIEQSSACYPPSRWFRALLIFQPWRWRWNVPPNLQLTFSAVCYTTLHLRRQISSPPLFSLLQVHNPCNVNPSSVHKFILNNQIIYMALHISPLHVIQTVSEAHPSTQPPIQWVPVAHSPQLERPGCESDHSSPTSAEVKNMWIYTSIPSCILMA